MKKLTLLLVIISSIACFGEPAAYDADLPSQMNEGEYVLGYEPAYVNQTNHITAPWAYIGNNTGGNSLTIKQGCTLASFKNFVIGGSTYGTNNYVLVQDGALSTTNEFGAIFTGFNGGASNTFVIAPEGYVSNNYICRVGQGAGANYNTCIVSGGVWKTSYRLYAGENTGSYNQFSVIEGGKFYASEIRLNVTENSDYNKVLIDGSNSNNEASSVILTGGVLCGYYGMGAEFTVENGGYIESVGSTIGRYGQGNNRAQIDGTGSIWTNLSYINVGWTQHTNSLEITNGGQVHVEMRISAGYNGGIGNSIMIDGENSLITTGDIQIGHKYATNNIMTVRNGGKVELTDSLIISSGAGTYANKVILSSPESLISAVSCIVGDNGSYSTFDVSDQAAVNLSTALTIGDDATGNNNSAVISDRNTTVSVGGVVYIGLNGSSNTLTIANNALVQLDGYDIRLDHTGTAINNFLQMQGGYFAWAGNKSSALTSKESKFKIWNKITQKFEKVSELSEAEKEALNYSITYCATDEEAEAITGYDGLGGYTILTGGDNTIPPKGTLLIIK